MLAVAVLPFVIPTLVTTLVGAGAYLLWIKVRETILCSLKLFFCWLIDQSLTWVLAPVAFLLSSIPVMPDGWDFPLAELVYCLNIWLPLSEVAQMLIVYWTTYTAFVVFRLIKSVLPGLSN